MYGANWYLNNSSDSGNTQTPNTTLYPLVVAAIEEHSVSVVLDSPTLTVSFDPPETETDSAADGVITVHVGQRVFIDG